MSEWAIAIENDLKWREAELASLKHHAIATRDNPVAHKAALRALWAMLYAHYEGFTKFCWEIALDEIERSKTKRQNLIDTMAVGSLESFFSNVRGNTSSDNLWTCFRSLLANELMAEAVFPEKYRPSTDSNLWPHVFRRETRKFGISCSEIDHSDALIKALVSRRNKIAHGETMTIRNLAEYEPFEASTTIVMHELAVAVLDLLENKQYCKL